MEQQTKTVSIYSTPTCHFCHMAKDFFTEKGILFTDYDVAEDTQKRSEMVDKTGQLGVPVISIVNPAIPEGQEGHENVVIGFDEGRIRQLLNIV
jgi:glutaredoxin